MNVKTNKLTAALLAISFLSLPFRFTFGQTAPRLTIPKEIMEEVGESLQLILNELKKSKQELTAEQKTLLVKVQLLEKIDELLEQDKINSDQYNGLALFYLGEIKEGKFLKNGLVDEILEEESSSETDYQLLTDLEEAVSGLLGQLKNIKSGADPVLVKLELEKKGLEIEKLKKELVLIDKSNRLIDEQRALGKITREQAAFLKKKLEQGFLEKLKELAISLPIVVLAFTFLTPIFHRTWDRFTMRFLPGLYKKLALERVQEALLNQALMEAEAAKRGLARGVGATIDVAVRAAETTVEKPGFFVRTLGWIRGAPRFIPRIIGGAGVIAGPALTVDVGGKLISCAAIISTVKLLETIELPARQTELRRCLLICIEQAAKVTQRGTVIDECRGKTLEELQANVPLFCVREKEAVETAKDRIRNHRGAFPYCFT